LREKKNDKYRISICSRILRFGREKEKYEEVQKEENKRIQKDKILDEEEDEEKEEEDEYVEHYQKRNVNDDKI
jgi:hypothetical protein